MAIQTYQLVSGDWIGLERIINDLTSRITTQTVGPSSSPTFAGLTLTGFSGILKGTAGVVGTITDNSTAWNAAQPGHANLTSLAGLTFASTSFVKMTTAGTFGLDTASYLPLTGGTLTGNLLFTDATYDIGATGATRPRNLFLSQDATIGRNVIGTGYGRFDGGIGVNIAPSSGILVNFVSTVSAIAGKGIGLTFVNTRSSGSVTLTRGIDFIAAWTPAAASVDRTCSSLQGGNATIGLSTANIITGNNFVVTSGYGYSSSISATRGTSHTGNCTITNAYNFYANNGAVAGGATITNLYGFYDAGQTVGGTANWGIGINTTNNYINGSLSIGKNTVPAVPLDVVGAIQATTTIEAGTNFRCNTVAGITDSAAGTIVDIHSTGGLVTAVTRVTPAADGTYATGLKLTPVTGTDGSITITNGIITAITAAT